MAHTFAYGASQSGRFLREFVYQGLNLDEAGQALDGVHPHVASARLGEFNQRFGQPSVHHTIGFGHRGRSRAWRSPTRSLADTTAC